jgi:hypothetical protein
MTNNEIVRALRENANALRRIAMRPEVRMLEENELRMVAGNIDDIALEFSTAAKAARPPKLAKASVCPDCNGTGEITSRNGMIREHVRCVKCSGVGEVNPLEPTPSAGARDMRDDER